MTHKDKLITQVSLATYKFGLSGITPIVLSDNGNMIIHLSPHPIVARVAKFTSKESPGRAKELLARELEVANHLNKRAVAVLLPINMIDPGPHAVGGVWMTFWEYIPNTQLQPLIPSESVKLVRKLSIAMKDFSNELPVLGVWNRVCQSAKTLSEQSDHRIKSLFRVFDRINERMKMTEPTNLLPAHGDAHVGNLLPSPRGWLWMDFEDASLMPDYWDLASYVAHLVLFKGFDEPTFRYMLDNTEIVSDFKAFKFALTARTLMSTIGNLDLAIKGYGDLSFARRQLELVEDFLLQVDSIT